MESQFEDLEKKIIDELFPKESQAFLTEYFINGLFGENKNFFNNYIINSIIYSYVILNYKYIFKYFN